MGLPLSYARRVSSALMKGGLHRGGADIVLRLAPPTAAQLHHTHDHNAIIGVRLLAKP